MTNPCRMTHLSKNPELPQRSYSKLSKQLTEKRSQNMNNSKDNNSSAGIGGLAGVLSSSEQPSSSSERKNVPLMTVMHNDPNATGPNQLQIEQADELLDELEDSDEERPRGDGKRAGRRKIRIEYIGDKSRRHITFSKRKAGIMKKAYELSTLTGTQVLLLVASETGHVYTFATPKLQPLITKQEGKNLIQACLNSPDMPSGIPEYPLSTSTSSSSVSGTQSVPSAYETAEIVEEDPNRTNSNAFSALSGLSGYAPYGGMVNSGSITPTPSGSGASASTSAASAAAAAAAQVFMNPQVAGYSYPGSNGGGGVGNPSAAYWQGNPNLYAPSSSASSKMTPSVQSQQQQMYNQAMFQQQQQQQYMQQLHHQQQQQHQHQHLLHQHQQQASSQSSKSGLLDLSENIVDHE